MRLKLLVAVILFCIAAPAIAQPANLQFNGDTLSTNLPLVESKEAIHRVVLKCQLADGGKGTLTLDPSVPTFDEFGNLVAGGKQSHVVALEFTLKLVKNEKEQQLYDIRGPKIVSRLSLAAFPYDQPCREARLLVHDKGGEVRYVISLNENTHRGKPPVSEADAHPGYAPTFLLASASQQDGKVVIQMARPGPVLPPVDGSGKPDTALITEWVNLRKVTLGDTVQAFGVNGEPVGPKAVLKTLDEPKGVAVFFRSYPTDPLTPAPFYRALLHEGTISLVVRGEDIYNPKP